MLKTILLSAALALAATACHATPAAATAAASGPACAAQAPFYWEVGDANGNVLASGSVGARAPRRDTRMSIASASKWVYGTYVDQVRGGNPTADDLKYLNLRSGYTRFDQCATTDTVGSCSAKAIYVRRTDGKFDYGGGHMQHHAAAIMGLGALDNAGLAAKINGAIGTSFVYSQPQLAGGVATSAAGYAAMLTKIMRGELAAGAHLADNAVPTTGPTAIKSPVPEPWQYGRGHWIEQDGTVSSPGAFGFYPWIDVSKRYYGIVARTKPLGAWDSVTCGREIRKAFLAP